MSNVLVVVSDMEEVVKLGERLGLQKAELKTFVLEQQEKFKLEKLREESELQKFLKEMEHHAEERCEVRQSEER